MGHFLFKYNGMGKLRSINTRVWSDTWFEELTAEQKLLFFYLITNEKTNMLGMYEISVRKMAFETNIKQEKVEEYLMVFNRSGRVRYHKNTVILSNFLKHQKYNLNMKLSAIDTYNNLPNELKVKGINKIERDAKGFETLRNHYGTVSKLEAKDELEDESEEEDNNSLGDSDAGKPAPKPKSSKNLLAKRQKEFFDDMVPFVEEYGREMVRAFYDYWSEPNKSRTKMKWELERTWDLNLRLKKWRDNDDKWSKPSNVKPLHQQKPDARAVDVHELLRQRQEEIERDKANSGQHV